MKCVITEGTAAVPRIGMADVLIAYVKGEAAPKRPRNVRYENQETGEKYFCLAGGFAWPGMSPGFACVVAALEGPDPDAPTFKVVAEVGDTNVQPLIERAYAVYEKYGVTCTAIPWTWYGENDEAFTSFLHRFNERQRRAGIEEHFFLVPPPRSDQPNRFEFYNTVLSSLLLPGQKRLLLGEHSALPAYLKNLSQAEGITGTTKDHPAVAALGYVVSALVEYRPWLTVVEDPGSRYDPHSSERVMLQEQDATNRLLRAAYGVDEDSLIVEPCGGIE